MDFNRTRIIIARCFILAGICILSTVAVYAAVGQNPQAAKPEPVIGAEASEKIPLYPAYPPSILKPSMDPRLVKRGEYLVKVGDCIACHTNTAQHGKPFAGGLALNTPFGTFFTPNITPDKETGIGDWSYADFIRAMHQGVNPQGQYYFPVFPYTSFTKVSREDLIAIKAYLDTLPPVYQKNKPPTARWPFNWRFAQVFWRTLFFRAGYYQYDPEQSRQWNRGAYLVQGLGHCGECHTPRNFLGAMKTKYYLTGAFVDGFWAPDITRRGLAGTSFGQLADDLAQGEEINAAGPMRGPMDEVVHDSLKYMTPADLQAIAVYLKSVQSLKPRAPHLSTAEQKTITPADSVSQFDAATLKAGSRVYDRACALCHDSGMAGAPTLYDTQIWTQRLKQGLPRLYQHAIEGFNQMPPKGGCVNCTDDEIKAAVDYMIAHSQNPVAQREVAGAETSKADTSIAHGEQIYEKTCYVCHDAGKLGAPKLGDQDAWAPLLRKNLDILILNTLKGMGNMPPKGGCDTCQTSDIIAAVKYMAQKADPKGDYSLW